MFILRLFHHSQPFVQLQSREFVSGRLSVGRDSTADWIIDDPSRTLSRLHCAFEMGDEGLTLCDVSTNGVFVGADNLRLPRWEPMIVRPGEPIHMGDYILLVEKARDGAVTPIGPHAFEILEAAATGPAEPPTLSDGALLESFCAGAGLNASDFSGEDPAQVMRRVGAIYRKVIFGLGALMNERTLAKAEYQLERTTVSAAGNNPFRWAPADRVAVDLLRPRSDGFLSGPDAVEASFADLQAHLVCTVAGADAAVASTLQALAPKVIEKDLKSSPLSLKSKAAEAWSHYLDVYEKISSQDSAFREAYERRHAAFDAKDTVA